MKKAIYAFSGDPITFGHIDIIKRTAENFDEVIVGIGSNPGKHYMFSLEDRTQMANKALINIKNAKVKSFRGLLVDYAYEQNISVIVKGVRNSTDFDYENILHQVGESQKLGIDTFILFARPTLAHISSSTVKAIVKEYGFIHEYVPLSVKQQLEKMICDQFIIGVTGEIGVGKSYIADEILSFCKKEGIEAYNIDLDLIGHSILGKLIEPQYKEVRKKLINKFGEEIGEKNGMIDRKVLGQIVFNDKKALNELNEIMLIPILVRLKRELYQKKGIILLNGALLAEADMLNLCNNNVILINCDRSVQKARLEKRGLTKTQIEHRIESQYSFEDKKKLISKEINRTKQGKIWSINNSGSNLDSKINNLMKSLMIGRNDS